MPAEYLPAIEYPFFRTDRSDSAEHGLRVGYGWLRQRHFAPFTGAWWTASLHTS